MHVPLGDTYYFLFTTRSFSTGAPATLSGTPVLSVYEENNVTQITSGVAVSADYDSVTGLNECSVVASGANGYEVGKYYSVVITTGTVGGVSVVGEVVGHFRVMPAEDAGAGIPDVNVTHVGDSAQDIATATALATVDSNVDAILLDTGTDGVVVAAASKTGYSLTANTGLGNQTANITGNLSGSVGSVTAGVSLAATATSAQLVDDVWDEVLSAAAHNVANSAGRRLRQLQDLGTYALAAAWVDTVNGTSTGTTDFEDATVTNRSTTFNNAQTVAASVGLSRIFPANGNSVTLTQTINNFEIGIPGGNWTLALGGQDIGGCDINDAIVSGIATGTGPHFHRCFMGACTIPPSELFHCGIGKSSGTLTVGSAGDYKFIDCYSDVPGSSAPVVDLGAAVGASTMEFRRWSGGLTLNNVAAGDVISVDVVSGGTITVNGTGGTVVIRGMCNVVDGSSGSVSITETSVVNMTKINAEADTAISDAGLATAAALATVDGNVDTIVASTLSTAAAAQLEQNLNNCFTGTASGTPTTTTMVSNIGVTVDDQFKGRIITFDDDTTTAALRGQSTDITACTAASNTLTFTALTTAPASGDTFVIT